MKLRKCCKEQLLLRLASLTALPSIKIFQSVLLVLDDVTSKQISAIVAMTDLYTVRIMRLGNINKDKQPGQQAAAIYFITPNSIPRLLQEFELEKSPFQAIALLINTKVTNDLLAQISSSQSLMGKIAAFGQLKFDFRFFSQKVSLFSERVRFKELSSKMLKFNLISESLGETLLGTCGIPSSWSICYDSSTEFSPQLALSVKEVLQKASSGQASSKASVNVLIVDRKIDYISPLVGDSCYLTTLSRLLPLQIGPQGIIVNLATQRRSIDLSSQFARSYMFLPLPQAIDTIKKNFSQYSKQNEAAKFAKDEKSADLKAVLDNLPEYAQKGKQFNLHFDLLRGCSDRLAQVRYDTQCEFQQLVATGLSNQGQPQKDRKILQKCQDYLKNVKDQHFSVGLITLMLLCLQLSESQKSSLLGRLSAPNLKSLVEYLRRQKGGTKLSGKNVRFECRLATLMTGWIAGLIGPSFKSVKIQDNKSGGKQRFEQIDTKSSQKWILVVTGGLAVNEMVQLENSLAKTGVQWAVLTTNILTQHNFIEDLSA